MGSQLGLECPALLCCPYLNKSSLIRVDNSCLCGFTLLCALLDRGLSILPVVAFATTVTYQL